MQILLQKSREHNVFRVQMRQRRDKDDEFQIGSCEMRFAYAPNDLHERDKGMKINDVSAIQGYFCTYKSGAQTLSSCAHFVSFFLLCSA